MLVYYIFCKVGALKGAVGGIEILAAASGIFNVIACEGRRKCKPLVGRV